MAVDHVINEIEAGTTDPEQLAAAAAICINWLAARLAQNEDTDRATIIGESLVFGEPFTLAR